MPQRDEYGHTRCKSIKKTLHSHIIYYKKQKKEGELRIMYIQRRETDAGFITLCKAKERN